MRVCTICGAPVGSSHMRGPKERLSWLKPRGMTIHKVVIPQKDIKKVMEKLGLK